VVHYVVAFKDRIVAGLFSRIRRFEPLSQFVRLLFSALTKHFSSVTERIDFILSRIRYASAQIRERYQRVVNSLLVVHVFSRIG
jgi:hypothetical protein